MSAGECPDPPIPRREGKREASGPSYSQFHKSMRRNRVYFRGGFTRCGGRLAAGAGEVWRRMHVFSFVFTLLGVRRQRGERSLRLGAVFLLLAVHFQSHKADEAVMKRSNGVGVT